MAENKDNNLIIVKSSELGDIAKFALWRDRTELGLESVIELTPYYQSGTDEEVTKLMPFIYITLLKEFNDKGFPGFIDFIKSDKFVEDTGLIDAIITEKLNEIFKYVVVRRSIGIESCCLDFEELYSMKDKVKEINEGLSLFGVWLKTQRVLYTEEFKTAMELCEVTGCIKEKYADVQPTPYPIMNGVSLAIYRDMRQNYRKDLVDKITLNDKYTVSPDTDAKLYEQLEGFYADKDKFFNILKQMYLFVFSPYEHLGGLFKYKVYRTLDGAYTIVNCRTY